MTYQRREQNGQWRSRTYRQTQFIKDSDETINLGPHLGLGFIPEVVLVGLLETNSSSFLQRADTAVADAGMGSTDGLNKVLRTDQPSNAPTGAVKVLASRANSEGQVGNFRRQGSHASEGRVVETIVDLIAQDDDVVFDAQVTDCLQLLSCKDLANGVVRSVENDHAGVVVDGSL